MTDHELIKLFSKIQKNTAVPEEKLVILKEISTFLKKLNRAVAGAAETVEEDAKIQGLRKLLSARK